MIEMSSPGRDVAQQLGADDVERARLAGDAVAVAEPAEDERAQAVRVAEGEDAVLRHDHRRERALEARQTSAIASSIRSAGCEASSAAMISESDVERNDTPCSRSSACSSTALIEVAVVGEGDLAAVGAMDRLRVLPRVGARRRVADVPEGQVAAERAELLLVEDLVDQAQLAQGHDVPAHIGRGDACRLLPAVLQRVEREVGEPGDVVLGRRRSRIRRTRRVARRDRTGRAMAQIERSIGPGGAMPARRTPEELAPGRSTP